MISVYSAYIMGLRHAWREKKMILLVYAFNVFFAYLITIPVSMMLQKAFANRIGAAEMLNKFDFTYYLTVIRDFGTGLDVSRLILTFGVLYIFLNMFFAGGILSVFHQQQKFNIYEFFSGCLMFLGRFVRLFLFSLVLLLFVMIIFILLGTLSGFITDNATTEFWPFMLFFIRLIVLIFLLAFLNMLFDYAKIMTVVNDYHGMYQTVKRAYMFVLMNMGKSTALYFLYLLTTVIFVGIYLGVEQFISVSSVIAILIFFIWSQLFMVARMWLRLSFFAGQYAFFKFSNTAIPGMTKEMLDEAVRQSEDKLGIDTSG